MSAFVQEFQLLNVRKPKKAKSMPLSTKVRWVITDKTKFETLIEDLSHFVCGLDKLLPYLGPENLTAAAKLMLKEDLDCLQDLHTARLLQEAVASGPAHVAEATEEQVASLIRQRILRLLWFRAMDDRREEVAPAQ